MVSASNTKSANAERTIHRMKTPKTVLSKLYALHADTQAMLQTCGSNLPLQSQKIYQSFGKTPR